MIRLIVAFFVVINVLVALLSNSSFRSQLAETKAVPVIQGDELILVSEVDPSELVVADVASQVVEASEDTRLENISVEFESVLTGDKCVILSSFEEQADADALAEELRSLGAFVETTVETVEVDGPIMVYIKPFASAQEAQRELRVLRSSGLDSFIIADGELINGISLGVFRTEQNALAQQVRIKALGYQVEVNRFAVDQQPFSLVVSGDVLLVLDDDYWLKIASENKGVSIQQKECNEVASEGKFQ